MMLANTIPAGLVVYILLVATGMARAILVDGVKVDHAASIYLAKQFA